MDLAPTRLASWRRAVPTPDAPAYINTVSSFLRLPI